MPLCSHRALMEGAQQGSGPRLRSCSYAAELFCTDPIFPQSVAWAQVWLPA